MTLTEVGGVDLLCKSSRAENDTAALGGRRDLDHYPFRLKWNVHFSAASTGRGQIPEILLYNCPRQTDADGCRGVGDGSLLQKVLSLPDGEGSVQELALAAGVDGRRVVAVAVNEPLGREEPVHPHGAAGVDPAGGDAHFGAETHPVAVRHPAMERSWLKGHFFKRRLYIKILKADRAGKLDCPWP